LARVAQPGGATAADALAAFDALEPVDVAFMLGAWTGESWPSGHALDGVLEAYGWVGKRFDSPDAVHPLVFRGWGGDVHLKPAWVLPALPLVLRHAPLRSRAFGRLVRAGLPLFATRRSRGRLRMTGFRGRCSATLVYDDVPILDAFRALDRDTVMGCMDLKGTARPFFFLLRRAVARP
jgi:hypothetical protein